MTRFLSQAGTAVPSRRSRSHAAGRGFDGTGGRPSPQSVAAERVRAPDYAVPPRRLTPDARALGYRVAHSPWPAGGRSSSAFSGGRWRVVALNSARSSMGHLETESDPLGLRLESPQRRAELRCGAQKKRKNPT